MCPQSGIKVSRLGAENFACIRHNRPSVRQEKVNGAAKGFRKAADVGRQSLQSLLKSAEQL